MDFDEEEPRLFAVYLGGGSSSGRLTEDHEVVHVVAQNLEEARRVARGKWMGVGRAHVDAVRLIDVVDGFRVLLHRSGESESSTVDLTYAPAETD